MPASEDTENEEWVPLVTPDGVVCGKALRGKVHDGSYLLHPVVHVHVISTDGTKLLLQKRPASKKIQPSKWDTAVGGHISAGETPQQAVGRETWEEIGVANPATKPLAAYVWRSEAEDEYIHAFTMRSDGPFECKNAGEVDELRFWSPDEISRNIGGGVFTPNLESELDKFVLPLMRSKPDESDGDTPQKNTQTPTANG